ncbi:unnamed protein product [Acidithrix sp. C25]|nr:unnamed protein product [Acidithrix sp. C25]
MTSRNCFFNQKSGESGACFRMDDRFSNFSYRGFGVDEIGDLK